MRKFFGNYNRQLYCSFCFKLHAWSSFGFDSSLYLPNIMPFLVLFSARLRGVHDGLFTGQIDAVDTCNATYRVTFDRTGLGTHTIPDYEVLVSIS